MLAILLQILWIFVSLFLILIILLQRGKGGGLAGALGGAGGSSAFGTKAGDVFTRITVGVFGFWLLLAMILVWTMRPAPKARNFADNVAATSKSGVAKDGDKGGAETGPGKGADDAVTRKSDERINDALEKMLKEKEQKPGGDVANGGATTPPAPTDGKSQTGGTKKESDKSEPPKGEAGKSVSEKSAPAKEPAKTNPPKNDAAKPEQKANSTPTKAPGSGMINPAKDSTEAVAMVAKYLRESEGDFDDSHMTDVEKAQLAEKLSKASAIKGVTVPSPAKTGGK